MVFGSLFYWPKPFPPTFRNPSARLENPQSKRSSSVHGGAAERASDHRPPGRFRLARGRRHRAARQEGLSRQDRVPVVRRARRKSVRLEGSGRPAALLGAEIEFFDFGDYPLKLDEQHFDRMVDIYRETNPSVVLTHALEDPYNFDHPNAAHFAQETRVVAQAMGHKPGAKYKYSAPPGIPFRAAPAGNVQLQT